MKWASWDEAAMAALLAFSLSLALGRVRPTRWTTFGIAAGREFAFTATLYSVWRLARTLPIAQEAGALERARQINRFQDAIGLPSELGLQQWLIPHDTLARLTTAYYAIVHVPSIIAFLIWLFVRHRDHYPRWRTGLALLTFFCLLIRFVRVAPPRFLPELGFVDLSTRFGMSVYGPVGTGASDQFAAMPSIHVGWAAVVTFGIIAASPSRWRWLALVHLAITVVIVSATGHHWWLDGIVAFVLLAVALRIDTWGRRSGWTVGSALGRVGVDAEREQAFADRAHELDAAQR